MDSLKLCTLLQKKSIRALPYGERLISIYDDFLFENYDYDIIEGSLRQDIRAALLSLNYKALSSRIFVVDELKLGFPKPQGTLGTNPAAEVLRAYKSLDFIFVTPTQALLTSLSLGKEFNVQQAKELIYHHPANLTKVRQWSKEEKLDELFSQKTMNELMSFQEKGIKLRKRKELGRFQLRKEP